MPAGALQGGALVSAYLADRPVSAGVVWLAEAKGEGGQRAAGLLVYPNAAPGLGYGYPIIGCP